MASPAIPRILCKKGRDFVKRVTAVVLLCLILCGCVPFGAAEYHSVTPHKVNKAPGEQTMAEISNYQQMKDAIEGAVESGQQKTTFSVENYVPTLLNNDVQNIVYTICTNHPIGTYAVESIDYEVGTVTGVQAVALNITYNRNPDEIANIKSVEDVQQARELIEQALIQCDSGIVVRIRSYEETDFSQLVEDYAEQNPEQIMERPQVTASLYPDRGEDRVVDIRFVYQTNREALRQMQIYVQPVFRSAELYVSSEEESDAVKYARLHTFLMERNDYKVETSITPTYSLLRHGVGDSRAFATVYAAMCRKAGLLCYVVSGTCNGEARFWNIIRDGDICYHVDHLIPGGFARFTDQQMAGYVWDYSAYPACGVVLQPEGTE